MELYPSQHRFNVRIVATIDLIFSVISIICPFVIFVILVNLTFTLTDRFSSNHDFDISIKVAGLWVVFFIVLAVVVLEITAAVKLFNSTQMNMEPKTTAKLARFWRNCTIFMTLLLIAATVTGKSIVVGTLPPGQNTGPSAMLGINLCFRAVGLFIVHQYIREMEKLSTRLPTSAGNRVFYNVTNGPPIILMSQLPPPYSQQNPPGYFPVAHGRPQTQFVYGFPYCPTAPPQPQQPQPQTEPTEAQNSQNSPPPDYEEAMKMKRF